MALLALLLILSVHTVARAQNVLAQSVRELARSSSSVTLEITMSAPRFDTVGGTLHPGSSERVAIPVRASRRGTVSIVSLEKQTLALSLPIRLSDERDLPVVGKVAEVVVAPRAPLTNAVTQLGSAVLKYAGRMRGTDISSLTVHAWQRTSERELQYVSKIVVKITEPSGVVAGSLVDLSEPYRVPNATLRERIAQSLPKTNSPQSNGAVQQLPGIRAQDGNVYRMYVRKSGIYHVTFDDLKHFGIDPATIDPRTLRVINHDQQVPVYVYDHQDGTFDPNDYIEFFGEEKLYDGPGKFGDFYHDPDTKDNIYFLVWGDRYSPIPAGGLKRIVEESGEIREASRDKYVDLRDSSFPSRIHFEQDNTLQDLELCDVNERSDLRDHNFMAVIYAGKTYSVQTVVPFPDVRSNRPFTMRVALHGISHFDAGSTDPKGIELPDVPNEHEAEISINDHLLLHGTWDSQVMKFLSTDTASQRLTNLPTAEILGVNPRDTSGGIPPITVTFANRKQTDVNGCRFAVNWFDLTYDRMYYAYQNELTFHAPVGSPAGLYQFTLQNFGETDISIYRKGVSKITNAVLTSKNEARSAKAVFQLNVSGDADEFIAVVDTLKLKPFRYAIDDYLDLRSPTNDGEYLIITSKDHLRKSFPKRETIPLEQLLSNRRDAHHLTGKLIDVANIYDEFSGGARSPNAIKRFLTYAYQRWQAPPKYVLLVGSTHPGTGDSMLYAPPDQVPAPYIQAFQEGAIAADPWYAMIDGDDVIPDLLIGRVASLTIDEDDAYLQKVLQYERDAMKPGDWKDRAAFVAADAGFAQQVDDLLTSSVPKRVFSLRQSIHRSLPYYGNTQTLVDRINAGTGAVVYLGHGGDAIWADPQDSVGAPFLTNNDLTRFHNQERYPIVLSLTCFTAGYDGGNRGLLNGFLTLYGAGSVAGVGTTGFGWAINDFHMGQHVLPQLFDTLQAPFAERVLTGKVQYLLSGAPGDLIPVTLMYGYHFLGDPYVAPHPPEEHVSLTLSSRVLPPSASATITGATTLRSGTARLELVNETNSPLEPPHVLDNVNIVNGTFTANDQLPATLPQFGSYRAVVFDNTDARYGATSADVTIMASRVTELRYDPYPLPAGAPIDLSAAVQSPSAITSVTGYVDIYREDAGGAVTRQSLQLPMTAIADRYHATIDAAQLQNGDRVVSRVQLVSGNGPFLSDTISAVVGAAADPAAYRDPNHRSINGKHRVTPGGLVWRENVYNWGTAATTVGVANLVVASSGVPIATSRFGAIPAKSSSSVDIPVDGSTLDSIEIRFAVAPDFGTSPFNLRDSVLTNDTTSSYLLYRGAISYLKTKGTTIDGIASATGHFNNDEVTFTLGADAEGNVASDVIRLQRQYDRTKVAQPDIFFLPLYSFRGTAYSTIRIVSDSLGAIPLAPPTTGASVLSLKLNLSDSSVAAHAGDSLFIYRQDDRTKLWTQLKTIRVAPDQLLATVTNLGNFAVAYHTDRQPPVVDMTVEGQIFTNHGEVPKQPYIHAVLQDANGIDVTPGKTTVKIDDRLLDPTEYVILDSSRTPTTVNLRMEPSLSDGNHTISIQTTDNNGLVSVPKVLDVHVSKDFGIATLGSYPNPFTKDYMFIAYEIRGTASATEASLDIYTVSGRRIRTMTVPSGDPNSEFGFFKGGTGNPLSLGYHEIWWDGRDDSGVEVANGAYFYRLRVKTRDDSREVTGKFARVR